MFQDDTREVLRLPVAEPCLRHVVDQFVVFVDAENAVRRNALHREGTGDADLPSVLVGLVVQVLEVGLGCDGGVNLPLAGDAGLPPLGVKVGSGRLPRVAGGVGNVVQCVVAVQRPVQRAERCLLGLGGVRCTELVQRRGRRLWPGVSGLSGNLPLFQRAPERIIQRLYPIDVLIPNLHKNRPTLTQQIPRHRQPIPQIRQIRMNPVPPRVPERLHLLRLAADVLRLPVLHVPARRGPLEVRVELDAVGRIEVDALHLAAPDELRVEVAVSAFVRNLDWTSVVLRHHGFVLRGGDVSAGGVVVGQHLDGLGCSALRHVVTTPIAFPSRTAGCR